MLIDITLTPMQRFRFFNKIDTSAGPDACHPWTGFNRNDYGIVTIFRKECRATRVRWILERGPISDGLFVCHSCDNPVCVNITHLFLGTNQDNMLDMVSKNRFGTFVGTEERPTKLTEDQVKEIKWLLHWGNGVKSIATEFNVGSATIDRIKQGKSWKHVHGPRPNDITV